MLAIPNWPTQRLFPTMMIMLIAQSVLISPTTGPLQLPQDMTAVHPLHHKMSLLVWHLLGKASKAQACRTTLQKSYNVLMAGRDTKTAQNILTQVKIYCSERSID